MSGSASFQARVPNTRPIVTTLFAVAIGGVLVVTGLMGRVDNRPGNPAARPAELVAANRVLEQRLLAEARAMVPQPISRAMTEAEILERIALTEGRLLSASGNVARALTETDVLEARALAEARVLAAAGVASPDKP